MLAFKTYEIKTKFIYLLLFFFTVHYFLTAILEAFLMPYRIFPPMVPLCKNTQRFRIFGFQSNLKPPRASNGSYYSGHYSGQIFNYSVNYSVLSVTAVTKKSRFFLVTRKRFWPNYSGLVFPKFPSRVPSLTLI